jgi:hypothetical protein
VKGDVTPHRLSRELCHFCSHSRLDRLQVRRQVIDALRGDDSRVNIEAHGIRVAEGLLGMQYICANRRNRARHHRGWSVERNAAKEEHDSTKTLRGSYCIGPFFVRILWHP